LSAADILGTTVLAARTRDPMVLMIGAVGLGILNRDFYGLLHRRGGIRLAAPGRGLHALHHAAAIAAIPCGLVAHIRRVHGKPGARLVTA
jgi:hypothetical protein